MSETKKYKRKSGAITIVKQGRIVGNIGSGKEPPINHKIKVEETSTNMTKNSHIDTMYKKYNSKRFKSTQSDNVVNSYNVEDSISLEQLKILWHISPNNNIIEKLETFIELSEQLSLSEKTIFVDGILDDRKNEATEKIWYNINMNDDEISADILHFLSYSSNKETVKVILSHKNIGVHTFLYWSTSEDVERRRVLSKHWNIPPEIYKDLAEDDDVVVKCNIVFRRNISPEVLEKLAHDSSRQVRKGVASHHKTPIKTLEFLVQDSYDNSNLDVRDIIATNPSTPPELLVRLATLKST